MPRTAMVTTNSSGVFSFNPLPASTYTITVEAPGFKKSATADIVLNVNDRIGLPPIVSRSGLDDRFGKSGGERG
jgi:hypothetical protein